MKRASYFLRFNQIYMYMYIYTHLHNSYVPRKREVTRDRFFVELTVSRDIPRLHDILELFSKTCFKKGKKAHYSSNEVQKMILIGL